jgi:membrane protease YdiL (CAAX protease family)
VSAGASPPLANGKPGTAARPRSPWRFFALAYALAVPFWLLGAATAIDLLPGLPIAALMTVCPVAAALILVYRENGRAGVTALLKRSFDFQRIKAKGWYVPVVLLAPGVALLSYALLRWTGVPVPAPQFDVLTMIVLFLVFFVAALGEELGWSGYAIDPMQARWEALTASIMLGLVWAGFHFIPLLQVGRSVEWIAWWSLGAVTMRVVMVWLYNNTGRSVFAVALFHAMSNLAWQLFPIEGSYFDPRIHGLILAAMAVGVVIVWGPRTLSRLMPAGSTEPRY